MGLKAASAISPEGTLRASTLAKLTRPASKPAGALSIFALGLLALSPAACGTRSDPNGPLPLCTDQSGDTGGEALPGTCDNPVNLPVQDLVIRGALGGCDGGEGWCGADGAGDDVYKLTIQSPIDIAFQFREDETDFEPTLRVVYDAAQSGVAPCEEAPAVSDTKICAVDAVDKKWSILAQPGDYYLFVDGASGGDYALDVKYGVAAVGYDCPLESGAINLNLNDFETRNISLPAGQGILDGKCGGPGTELRFQVNVLQSGFLYAYAYDPTGVEGEVITSIRWGCAGNPEVACSIGAGSAYTEAFVSGPDTIFVVIDQATVTGADLVVEFGLY